MNKKTAIIEKLVPGGQALATLADGKKAFIWGAMPGETVEFELTKNKKTTLNIIHYNYKFKDLLPDTLAKQLKLDVDMIYALSGMPYGPYKNS